MIYFCIYVFLFFMSIIDFKVKKNTNYNHVYILFCLFIFLMVALRTMGNDYEGYHKIFDSLQGVSVTEIFDPTVTFVEPAFSILNIIAGKLFPFQAVIIIMAILNSLILFPFIKKYSPYPFLSFLLFAGMFMYSGMMGLIRQSLAVSICLWAMLEKNNKKFILLVITAMTFHYTVIFIVITRFFKNTIYSTKKYLLLGGIAIFSKFFFMGILKLLLPILPEVISWKLNIYIAEEAGKSFGINSAIILRLFAFILAYKCRFKILELFPKYGAMIINIYFLSIIFYVGFSFLPQIAFRGAMYFHYVEIILIPLILKCTKKDLRYSIFFLYALFSLWRHYEMVTIYGEMYYPYKTIFS